LVSLRLTLCRCLLTALIVALTGCTGSAPNLYIRAEITGELPLNRAQDRVIVSLKEEPTPGERAAIDQVRSVFAETGFTIVDNVREADRILYFGFASPEVIQQNLEAAGLPQNGTAGSDRLAYRGLEFFVMDTELARKRERDPIIWRALLLTTEENFLDHPNDVLRKAAELYGAQVTETGVLKTD